MAADTTTVTHSTCMMSHSGCGVIVHVRDGRVVKVEGDPDHPVTRGSLCSKGLSAVQFQNHPDRLLHPMKRAGERGEGRWERISWDEALDTIASRLGEIRGQYGPEAVAVACGTGRPILQFLRRYGNVLGTPNHAGCAHMCWRPQLGSAQVTFGRPIHYDLETTACMVVMGANWVHSNSGQAVFAREFMDVVQRGTTIITIDPRRSACAGQSTHWVGVRPGTDAALLLAWMNVIISEGLYDHEFVSRWTSGFDELAASVKDHTPEWAEQVTWVAADQIRETARVYATTKPACFTMGVAVEQSTNSFNTLRAAYILVALTGNVDVPGGNHFWENPMPSSRMKELLGRDRVTPEAEAKMVGSYPLVEGSSPGYTIWQSILSGRPYPVRAVLAHGTNPILTQENPRALVAEAFREVDFSVVMDFFLTPTAQLADIVLPAATYLEKNDLNLRTAINRGHLAFSRKVVEPRGEARDDREVFIEVCRRLGLDYGWDSVDELLDWMLEPVGMTFAQLADSGPVLRQRTYRKHELGRLRPDGQPGFATVSGKVELYSPALQKRGLDPSPLYREPPESPLATPDLAADYPLVLTSGSRVPTFFATQYFQLSWLREITPEPRVEIHPETAAALGIADGQWVYIENQRGRCRQQARLTTGVDPRVVHADYAWWRPERPGHDPGLFDVWDANINLLVSSDPPYDAAFGSTQMRGLLCRVYPVSAESGAS